MTKLEIIKETLSGIAFCLFFYSLIALASISDGIDETILEAVNKQGV